MRRASIDTAGLGLTQLSSRWLRHVRTRHRIDQLPRTRNTFMSLGVYPIIDHYYEPLITRANLDPAYRQDREVHGIDWHETDQWSLLERFHWQDELLALPLGPEDAAPDQYYLRNGYFGPGDADLYYSLIRLLQPKRIVEVGSGHSTRLAVLALQRSASQANGTTAGKMICVEPYRHPDWFPKLGVEHVEQPIEALGSEFFQNLAANDILFIDSSHMIRPQGDVLFLLQEVLPRLPKGVYIHVHDIFSPLDYPNEWLVERMHFWNEQYFLEAFLAYNKNFEIVASVQFLLKQDRQRAAKLLPRLGERLNDIGATSIWLRTV